MKKNDGSLATLPIDKANALNEQFCSVFTKENLSVMLTHKLYDTPNITEIVVTVSGVLKEHTIKQSNGQSNGTR